MNESGVLDRTVKSRPIKAQSADVAWATASICAAGVGNAERVVFGGQGKHEGFVYTFLGNDKLIFHA